jgi:hypothetical protein
MSQIFFRSSDMIEKLFGQDVADTVLSATLAGVIFVFAQIETVVKGDFFTRGDQTGGDDPDSPIVVDGIAIRGATVIDESSRIGFDIAIEIFGGADFEDKMVAGLAASKRFRFGYPFAKVFDDSRALCDMLGSECACAMNRGGGETD